MLELDEFQHVKARREFRYLPCDAVEIRMPVGIAESAARMAEALEYGISSRSSVRKSARPGK